MLPVPVTVVRHDPAEMGRIAAEMAYLRLDGDDGRPSGARSRATSSPADPGSCPRHDPDRRQAPAQPDPPLLPRRPGHRRAARDRRRRRPLARGVDRLGDDALRRERARAEPHARRRASSATRWPPIPRHGSGPTTPRASARAPRCWSSCSTPASACRSTTIPTTRSRTSTSDWTSARPRRGSSSRRATARRWPSAGARRSRRTRCAPGSTTQDHDALLGALNPVPVSAGDAVFVPAGVPHAIGDGILIAELQEPTDLSILLEWDGFGIDDEQAATLGLGWDVALASVERSARDPSPLRGPRGDGAGRRAPARRRRALLHRPAHRAGRRLGELPAGFAVVLVVEGARHAGRPRRDPRRRAARALTPRGPSAPTATSWPSPVAPRR